MLPYVSIYYQIMWLKQQLVCPGHTEKMEASKTARKLSILDLWPEYLFFKKKKKNQPQNNKF